MMLGKSVEEVNKKKQKKLFLCHEILASIFFSVQGSGFEFFIFWGQL
jgi:hypothetical protein